MENQENQEIQEKSRNPILIGIIIVQLLVIGVLLYLYISQKNENEANIQTIDTQSKEITQKKKEIEDLLSQYEQVKKEREALGLNNDSLNNQILKLRGYIDDINKSKKISESKLRELNKQIDLMRADLEAKDREIAALIQKNDSLTVNLTSVREEKTRMSDTMRTLSEKVSIAQILRAENIKVNAVKENGKIIEDDDSEFKLRKIDKIRVTFNLAENNVADHNSKTVYMAFVTPTGETFVDTNAGGGEVVIDGQPAKYTLSKTIDFDNSKQKLIFEMYRGFKYLPGLHAVELFCEGHKIGTASFVIKK